MTTGPPTPSISDRPPPRRSETQKIAGVAEGLGDAIGLDPSLVRIAFAVLALASGAGLVLYLGAWLLMLPPERAGSSRSPAPSLAERPTPALIFGGVLLGVGLLVGLMTLDGFNFLPASIIGLVFVGIVLLNRTSETARTMIDATGAMPPAPIVPPPPYQIPPPPVGDATFVAPAPWPPPITEPAAPRNEPGDKTEVYEKAPTPPTGQGDNTEVFGETTPPPEEPAIEESAAAESANDETNPPETPASADETAVLETPVLETPNIETPGIETPADSPAVETPSIETPADSSGGVGVTGAEGTIELPVDPPTLPIADKVTEHFIEKDIQQLEVDLANADFGVLGMQQADVQDDLSRAHWALARTEHETTVATVDNHPDPGPPLASITLAALGLLTGIGLVFNTLIGETVKAATLAGIGTVIVGIAVAMSAFTGRTLRLIPIAILSLLMLLASPFLDFVVADGIGSSEIRVSSLETLADEYGVGIGYLELRLDDLEITEDTEIDVHVGIGAMEITVPANTDVVLQASTEIGYIFLLDGERAGIGQTFNRAPGGRSDTGNPRLIINAETTIGEVSIYRARER